MRQERIEEDLKKQPPVMSYHYGVPPSHYTKFYDPDSPYSSGEYVHYAAYDNAPKRGHTRRASYNPSPKQGGYYSPAGSPPPWYEQDYATPRKQVYEQVYHEAPRRKTTRRASTTTKPTHKSKPSYVAPVATEKDAARAGIPAGYSIKNWDPTELPIILLGSVFDANSLGKWIYDWTVYRNTASHPFADVAGELWLLLIKLAGKMKRAEECIPRIRTHESRELIRDFVASADRLWEKFKDLLKECEYFMLKAAKREGNKKMGKNAGTEFVDSIFGRDRYLGHTEKLMQSIRTWNHRFDANCEDILRRPSVA